MNEFHWQVGSNVPGCLPEGDVGCFETFPAAVGYLIAELDTFADYCDDACSGSCVSGACGFCRDFRAAEEIMAKLRPMTSPDYPELPYRNLTRYTSRLAWWINKVPADKCDLHMAVSG